MHGAEGVALDRPDVGRQVELDCYPVQIRVAARDTLDGADHTVYIDVGQDRTITLNPS